MKKSVIAFVVFATAISIPPSAALARGKKSTSASPRPTAAVDTNDRITATSLTSISVTIATTHRAKEYKITPSTKITVNGQPETLSGLAVGMDISVTTLPNDPTTAAVIDAKIAKK